MRARSQLQDFTMKIEQKFIDCALKHIIEYGDTDIFPFPFELKFLQDKEVDVAKELAEADISKYHPMSLVEALVPKSKFGFRTAHQPFPVDSVIYTALVLRSC
jgi:hypothetical protein